MNRKIENLVQLQAAIQQLSAEQQLRESKLTSSLKLYAESFKPVNLIKSALRSAGDDKELKSMITSKGAETLIGLVVSQLLFRKSNPFVRTAATVLGTSFASGMLGDQASGYIDKLKALYKKYKSRKNTDTSEFDEEDIYNS
jgi:hypothetical protein